MESSHPRIVGRDADMRRLREAFDVAASGGQRAVIVSGEAGIGKSRLIADFLSTIDGAASVVIGRCYESQDMAPFVPVRQILRQLPAVVGPQRWDAALAPVATTLSGLMPAGLGAGAEQDLSPARVHEAVDLVFEDLSSQHPLVVVIEDLHWVDPSTLGLLGAILRYRTTGQRLVLLTYRTDDISRGHVLRGFLNDVDRGRLASRIDLGPLPREAIAQMCIAHSGRALSHQELDRLVDRSDGIPFFVEELLGLADGQLADSLRDVVLARYDRMSEPTRRILRILATGEHIDHPLLAGVAEDLGIRGDALDDALHEAVSGGIITVANGEYAFRHALSREAVADEILPGERDRFHAAYAGRLDYAADPSVAGEAARHWFAAHEPGRAFAAYLAALADARATFGFLAQSAILERIVEIWPLVPDAAARSGLTRARAVVAAADAADRCGHTARTRSLLDVAESLLEPEDSRGRGELLRLKHTHAATSGRIAEATTLGLEALGLLADFDDAAAIAARARIHSNLGGLPSRDPQDAAAHASAARALAAQLGDNDLEAYVRAALAVVPVEEGDEEAALALVAFARSTSFVSPEPELRFALNTADALYRVGRFAEVVELGRASIARAEQLRHARTWGALISANLADALAAIGELEEARGHAERTVALAASLDFAAYGVRQLVRLDILADRLEDAEALLAAHEMLLREAAAMHEEERWGVPVARAELALARGDHRAAWSALSGLSGEFARDFAPSEAISPLVTACQLIAVQRAAGVDLEETIAFAREALAIMPPTERTGRWQAIADAYATPTSAAWSSAADAADHRTVHRWLLAPILRHQAEALAAEGLRAEARAAAERSLETARSIRATRDVRRAGELLSRLGGSARRDGLLTAREREVLALVAEGLTNRQIGERLYMSPKTVSVHVTALLRKLEVSSRTEAAVRAAAVLGDVTVP